MSKDLNPETKAGRGGMGRRDFIRAGALGLGLGFGDWIRLRASGEIDAAGPGRDRKARSVIQLWMGGGPPHLDTFDPKPQAGEDYCGPYKRPIETVVAGIRISEMLPLLAKQAHRYSIIRSMTHPSGGHETATYIVMTGTLPSADLVYPAMGAVVALKRREDGDEGSLPPYITLTNPLGRFSEAGFLGTGHRTFAPGGDPSSRDFRVQGLVPARGITEERIRARRSLLEAVDSLARRMEKDEAFREMGSFREKAYGLLLGDARKAFDLSVEPDDLRERYGRNRFGQSCLLARRLVENGVPFITVNMGGWDTHRDNFGAMGRLLPVLDKGLSALLEDLAGRGLLEETIVTWYGEFGRTPRVAMEPPWFGGRHHFPNVFSAVVAGGGFQGGTVVGSSDARGENVRERPVYPWDLAASIYRLLGIDHTSRLPHPQGCVAHVSPLAAGGLPSGGLLTEIMAAAPARPARRTRRV